MIRKIEAVYEGGVFKPLVPVELPEGQRVQVTVPLPPLGPATPKEVEEMMRLAASVFEGLSDEQIDEMEKTWRRG
jgi:predicted DNA-binding antitoxin AbrB/MazE fold protein